MVFQFYGPGNAYHSLLLDAGDTDYVAYDPTRFNLVVRKPLYDKLVRYVLVLNYKVGIDFKIMCKNGSQSQSSYYKNVN